MEGVVEWFESEERGAEAKRAGVPWPAGFSPPGLLSVLDSIQISC
jgi:hypothetical protein